MGSREDFSAILSLSIDSPSRVFGSGQFPGQDRIHELSDALDLNPVDEFAGERPHEDISSLLPIDPSRTEVEKPVRVELPYRRSVGALHIVRQNLELGFGVDPRFLRNEQISILLLGIGLLRIRPHDDPTVEDCSGSTTEHPLVDLRAARMRRRVINQSLAIKVLLPQAEVDSREVSVGSGFRETNLNFIARQNRSEREKRGRE